MSLLRTVQVILFISIAGVLFSGYLSYYELFVPEGCGVAVVSCGPKPVEIANLPACVYGLAMYTIIFLLCVIALWRSRKRASASL